MQKLYNVLREYEEVQDHNYHMTCGILTNEETWLLDNICKHIGRGYNFAYLENLVYEIIKEWRDVSLGDCTVGFGALSTYHSWMIRRMGDNAELREVFNIPESAKLDKSVITGMRF